MARGGGLHGCSGAIVNCTIADNSAEHGGGLCVCSGSIVNCTIVDNAAAEYGAGLCNCRGRITNCVIWDNSGKESRATLHQCSVPSHCCIHNWNGKGEGNISKHPLFAKGQDGNFYLWSKSAGQHADSPCIDAGKGTAVRLGLSRHTTRTDGRRDSGVVDMGRHYALLARGASSNAR